MIESWIKSGSSILDSRFSMTEVPICELQQSTANDGFSLFLLKSQVFSLKSAIHFLTYFQLRTFPCAIQATAVSRRFVRVSSCFASTTHSTYSRFWLGGKA